MANFGPHEDFSTALQAACPLILSKPNATVTHLQEQDLALAKRTSKEYCAWLYYTPDDKYELSMLTDMAAPGSELNGQASCRLPTHVDDPRYSVDSLQHIFILHNHPFAGELSRFDISFAADMARVHSLVSNVGGKTVPLSIIAFFSNSRDSGAPKCDGFYQYVPATSELLRWEKPADTWKRKREGLVKWSLDGTFSIEREPAGAIP